MNKLAQLILTLMAVFSALGMVLFVILARIYRYSPVNWYGIGAFACSVIFVIVMSYCAPGLDFGDEDEDEE